jgi:hypothetical protein
MTRAGALGCAIVALLSIATPRAADDARAPELLQRLLQSQKAWRLLDPRVDLPGEDAESLASIQSRPPWLSGDFDRDGREDVAAIVVSGPPTRRRFGVVAIHAVSPRMAKWVTPLQADPIVNVFAEPFADAIAVYYCTECDAQPWFRWSGRAYELGLYSAGNTVALGARDGSGANLYVRPLGSAAKRGHVEPCVEARVHDVGGRPGARWYFVETIAASRMRGWVDARVVTAQGDCF